MIKKMNTILKIAIITAILVPEITNARSGWGPFVGGALVGSAIVGTAAAASQDRAARRATERDYYYSRMADREMQARNYEQQIANQRLLDENQRQRRIIEDLNQRMNAIEGKTGNRRTEQQEQKQEEQYLY